MDLLFLIADEKENKDSRISYTWVGDEHRFKAHCCADWAEKTLRYMIDKGLDMVLIDAFTYNRSEELRSLANDLAMCRHKVVVVAFHDEDVTVERPEIVLVRVGKFRTPEWFRHSLVGGVNWSEAINQVSTKAV